MPKPFTLSFPVGSLVRVEMEFESKVTGELADPTTIRVRTLAPAVPPAAAVQTDYVFGMGGEIVKDDVGKYHFDLDCDTAGVWIVRGEGEGEAQAAREIAINVLPTTFDLMPPEPEPGP